MSNRIIIVSNSSSNLLNFRGKLIERLIDEKFEDSFYEIFGTATGQANAGERKDSNSLRSSQPVTAAEARRRRRVRSGAGRIIERPFSKS